MTRTDRKRPQIDTKCLPIEPLAELRGRAVFSEKRAFFDGSAWTWSRPSCMSGVLEPQHTGRRPHVRGKVRIRRLAPHSRGTFPFPRRGGRPAGGDAPQVRGGPRPGAGRAAPPLRPPRRRAPSRSALARAFVAKAVRDLPTTAAPVDRPGATRRCAGCAAGAACRRSPANRRSPGPSRGSRRPGCPSACTGLWQRPPMRDRSSATYPGTRRRSRDGRGRRRSPGRRRNRSGGAVAPGRARGRSGSRPASSGS